MVTRRLSRWVESAQAYVTRCPYCRHGFKHQGDTAEVGVVCPSCKAILDDDLTARLRAVSVVISNSLAGRR